MTSSLWKRRMQEMADFIAQGNVESLARIEDHIPTYYGTNEEPGLAYIVRRTPHCTRSVEVLYDVFGPLYINGAAICGTKYSISLRCSDAAWYMGDIETEHQVAAVLAARLGEMWNEGYGSLHHAESPLGQLVGPFWTSHNELIPRLGDPEWKRARVYYGRIIYLTPDE